MDGGKTVILVSKIELLQNQSMLAMALPPRKDYGDNSECPDVPWLDCTTVTCNICSKFPQPGNVVINKEHHISGAAAAAVDQTDDSLSDESPTSPKDDSNDDENECSDLETPLYSEYIKWKGSTYHEYVQAMHSSCKLKQQAGENIPVRHFCEPTNVADENAIVVQVRLQDQEWKSIGYILGKKESS